MQFWKRITSLFAGASHKDSLEYFVNSKMPKNGNEVEYWIKVYQIKNGGGMAV